MKTTIPSWIDAAVPNHILSIPPYHAGKPIEELERELGIRGAVKLASNENPLGPSPLAVQAIEQHLKLAHMYPETAAPELREALVKHLGVTSDMIVLGNGSDEIIQFVAHLFIRPGFSAIVGSHTFSMYRICVEAFGGHIKPVPLKDYRFDLEEIARAITEETRLVFLTIPNNPTGTILSKKELDSFLDELPTQGIIVVLDEAYHEYVSDPDCPNGIEYVGRNPQVLVLKTFSKIYGLAGLRVGYGIAAPWLADLLNRVKPPFNVNSIAQTAAIAALEDQDHVNNSLDNNRRGLLYLEKELSKLGVKIVPTQANFLMISFEEDAEPVYGALLRKGVIVRHLASFGLNTCIRVTVGTEAENRRFVNALQEVLNDLGI
jgi:histidinol-phosphate aminotransferase